MLKWVRLKNFVEFREEQKVELKPGLNVFVGQNASGKTSILEGIRRTLSLSKNTTLSKVPDPMRRSYVVCKYEVGNDEAAVIYYSLMMYQPPDEFYKTVVYGDKDGQYHVNAGKVENDKKKPHYTGTLNIDGERAKAVFRSLEEDEDGNIEEIFNDLKSLTFLDSGESKCEDILSMLTDKVVFVFPMRGASPLEWSRSSLFSSSDPFHLEKNVKDEIIKWYLKEEYPQEVRDKEDEIFRILTDDSKVRFRLTPKGEACAYEEDSSSSRPITCIYSVSEGILMAKQMAILLTLNDISTLSLEEPTRNMHPQMVLRLRDRILFYLNKECEDGKLKKTILMTTHNPDMLSPWTASRVFVCKRQKQEQSQSSYVIPGSQIFGDQSLKTRRILTSNNFPTLCFATDVLFVEGETDYVFIKALEMKILEKHIQVKRILENLIPGEEAGNGEVRQCKNENLTCLMDFMSTLHIVKMDGETHRKRLSDVCDKLHLNYWFLLDKDAVVEKEEKTERRKVRDLGRLTKQSGKEVTKQNWIEIRESILTENNIFIWKEGDIEDMIMVLTGLVSEAQTKATQSSSYSTNASATRETRMTKSKSLDAQSLVQSEGSRTTKHAALKTMSSPLPDTSSEETIEKMLNKENLNLPVMKFQKKKKAKFKLFNKDSVTDENISRCMEIFLEQCNDASDDIVQLLAFILKCAKHRQTKTNCTN